MFWWNGSGEHPRPAWWMDEGGAGYYVDSSNQKSPPGGTAAQWKVFRGRGPLPPPILSSEPQEALHTATADTEITSAAHEGTSAQTTTMTNRNMEDFCSDIFVTECGHAKYVGRWRKGSQSYLGKRRNVWYGPKGGKMFWWDGSGQHPRPAWWMAEGGAEYYVDSTDQKAPPSGGWKVFRGKGSEPTPILSSKK